jgi:DNA polymerase sigma
MTLHFLQQKGIIPVLQEIGLNQKCDRIIDGWNTWYFDDLKNLPKVWERKQNNQTIAELFLEFLRYYSEVFNYDEDVVCCRQLAPLKRLEKMWTGRKMAIEGLLFFSIFLLFFVSLTRSPVLCMHFIIAFLF